MLLCLTWENVAKWHVVENSEWYEISEVKILQTNFLLACLDNLNPTFSLFSLAIETKISSKFFFTSFCLLIRKQFNNSLPFSPFFRLFRPIKSNFMRREIESKLFSTAMNFFYVEFFPFLLMLRPFEGQHHDSIYFN